MMDLTENSVGFKSSTLRPCSLDKACSVFVLLYFCLLLTENFIAVSLTFFVLEMTAGGAETMSYI